jgi:undecaprenyl-diphosphatase
MSPSFLQIAILGLVQGAAELLPVSSSAHVIIAEKLMRLAPSSPEMLFLIVMLHAGTMGAVIVYFWKSWKSSFFASKAVAGEAVFRITVASAVTAVVAMLLKSLIENTILGGRPGAAVEDLTSNLYLMAIDLAIAGALIVVAGIRADKPAPAGGPTDGDPIPPGSAIVIGLSQGLSLPFRGLSRSGSTISTAMLLGVRRRAAEEFSFALAVVITPPILGREFLRFYGARLAAHGSVHVLPLILPALAGMIVSFFAGLLALRWLSGWLADGRWHYFGYYCFAAAACVCAMAVLGF